MKIYQIAYLFALHMKNKSLAIRINQDCVLANNRVVDKKRE